MTFRIYVLERSLRPTTVNGDSYTPQPPKFHPGVYTATGFPV